MPTLQAIHKTNENRNTTNKGEVYTQDDFVPDERANLRPSEVVQTKLLSLMSNFAIPVSCQQMHRVVQR